MKINVNYITGQSKSLAFGIDRISAELKSRLKNKVSFKKFTYDISFNNSIVKQFFIYCLYPIKVRLNLLKASNIIHISDQGLAHLSYFLPQNKLIITCCDLIPLIFFQNNNFWQNKLLKFSFSGLNKAKKIIAISQSTKNDLISYVKIPSEKIEVVYPGINEKFKPTETGKKNFILYVGAYYLSKNLPVLFKAFAKVNKELPLLKLVIVNKKNDLPEELVGLAEKLKIADKVDFTGHISEGQLIKLYNQAQVLIQPSLYEGLGLPVLEAMVCGCPVICSNTSSLPEVVGEAGILLPPNDIESFSKAIYNVVKDENLKRQLVAAGFRQAKKFTWAGFANQIYKIYQSIS